MKSASRTSCRPTGADIWSVALLLAVLLYACDQSTWAAADDVRQRTCGAKALVAALVETGVPCELEDVLARLPNHGDNSSLQELSDVAQGYSATAVAGLRWKERPPVDAPPAIVPVIGRNQLRHFVAVLKWEAERILVQDDVQKTWVPVEALRRAGWDGTALHISTDIRTIAAVKPHWWDAGAVRWAVAAVCFSLAAVLHYFPVGHWNRQCTTLMKSSMSQESA